MVRLSRDGGADDEPERPRTRTALALPISKTAFATIVSAPRTYAGHSSHLEAHGIVLGLKWLIRSTRRHAKRTVVLVDAQAVLVAGAKGRSSGVCIARDLARIGSLTMAGDLLLKFVYIPSEDNPADAPSRGVVRRWRSRRSAIPVRARKGKLNRVVTKTKRFTPGTPPPAWMQDLDAKIYACTHSGPAEEQRAAQEVFANYCYSDNGESISSLFSM